MDTANSVKLQEELSLASNIISYQVAQLSALKLLLQQKDSILRESYNNYSKL